MTPTDAALLVRYRRMLSSQRSNTSSALAAMWDRLGRYDEADVAAFVRTTAPLLNGAKAATVATSTAFNSQLLGVAPPSVAAEAVATVADMRAPFTAVWHALSQGRPYEEAVAAGRSSTVATGETFLQSTARQTGDAVAAASGRDVRWQRVAEPNACDWCQERDGGIYFSSADGDYGHTNCHCDVIPLEE